MNSFEPKTISENLMFSTIRLQTSTGSGTGFFFQYEFDNNVAVPVIVTNKHVLNNDKNAIVKFQLHLEQALGINYELTLSTNWIFHSEYDLAYCYVQPIFSDVNKRIGKAVFYRPISEQMILHNLTDLSAIEDITMVGYPIGLSDTQNNLPLFRRGITATHPAIDFEKKKIGLIDCNCFPGSSGSPLFILNEGLTTDRKTGESYLSDRLIFLGILYEGYAQNVKGLIEAREIPTSVVVMANTQISVNIGRYIKSEVLLDFKQQIFSHAGIKTEIPGNFHEIRQEDTPNG